MNQFLPKQSVRPGRASGLRPPVPRMFSCFAAPGAGGQVQLKIRLETGPQALPVPGVIHRSVPPLYELDRSLLMVPDDIVHINLFCSPWPPYKGSDIDPNTPAGCSEPLSVSCGCGSGNSSVLYQRNLYLLAKYCFYSQPRAQYQGSPSGFMILLVSSRGGIDFVNMVCLIRAVVGCFFLSRCTVGQMTLAKHKRSECWG